MFDKDFFAAAAILAEVVGSFIYLRAVFRGETKPHLFSWIIWGVAMGLDGVVQLAEHGGVGAYATLFSAGMCALDCLLCMTRGEKEITRSDWVALIVGLGALPIWLLTSDPLLSVILISTIDIIGFYPTIRKSYKNPYEENITAFVIYLFILTMTLFALENYTMASCFYQVSQMAISLILVVMLAWRRASLSQVPMMALQRVSTD